MNPIAETLSAQAVQLPPEDRMKLVERILDSLDEPDASLGAKSQAKVMAKPGKLSCSIAKARRPMA